MRLSVRLNLSLVTGVLVVSLGLAIYQAQVRGVNCGATWKIAGRFCQPDSWPPQRLCWRPRPRVDAVVRGPVPGQRALGRRRRLRPAGQAGGDHIGIGLRSGRNSGLRGAGDPGRQLMR